MEKVASIFAKPLKEKTDVENESESEKEEDKKEENDEEVSHQPQISYFYTHDRLFAYRFPAKGSPVKKPTSQPCCFPFFASA